MLRVAPLDEPHVQSQPGALRQLLEKPRGEITRQTGDARLREVDIGDEQRPAGRFERDVRERLVNRHHGRAVPAHSFGSQRLGQRLRERARGRRDLDLRAARLDLEREIERCIGGEQGEQMVEDGHARRDVGLAASRDVHTRACAPLPGRRHRRRLAQA